MHSPPKNLFGCWARQARQASSLAAFPGQYCSSAAAHPDGDSSGVGVGAWVELDSGDVRSGLLPGLLLRLSRRSTRAAGGPTRHRTSPVVLEETGWPKSSSVVRGDHDLPPFFERRP